MRYKDTTFINKYTAEDVALLNEMINPFVHNINHHAVKMYTGIKTVRLFPHEHFIDISDEEIIKTLKKFIHFIAPSYTEDVYLDFVFMKSINVVPLYINNKHNLGLLAKWRLSVGK